MSSLLAFGNSTNTKQALLQRLENVLALKLIREDNVVWNGENGSLCGSIAQAGLADFERLTGIPVSIAMLADKLCREDETVGSEWTRAWLSAIRPGADLSCSETRLTDWLLTGPCSPLTQAETTERGIGSKSAELLSRLNELHNSEQNGDALSRDDWSSLQEQSINLSDANPDGHFTRQLCSFVEALSWPVGSSVTALTDAVEALRGATYFFSMMHCGWDSTWEQRTNELYRHYDEEVAARGLNDLEPGAEQARQMQMVYDELAAQISGYNQILSDMKDYRYRVDVQVRSALITVFE